MSHTYHFHITEEGMPRNFAGRSGPQLRVPSLTVRRVYLLVLACGVSLFVVLNSGVWANLGTDGYSLQTFEFPLVTTDDSFRSVDFHNHTYVFSAYPDTVEGAQYVRVVGLSLTNQTSVPYMSCLITDDTWNHRTDASLSLIPENHGFKYSGVFIMCPIPKGVQPARVSILSGRPANRGALNLLTTKTQYLRGQELQFVVCVPPLHRGYDNVNQLVEFVEVNRMLGADLIVFYRQSVSARLSQVIDRFAAHGLAEVIEWSLPFDTYTQEQGYVNVHYFGQLAAINDCTYRYRWRTRYVINTDMDEFIVPKLDRYLSSWVNRQITLAPTAAAFIMRTFLLYTYLPDHRSYFRTREMAKKYHIITLLKTNRTEEALPFNIRPKYIYDPKRVMSVGIHNIWSYRSEFHSQDVPPEDCAIYHYRNTLVNPNPNGSITDTHFHTFQYDIVQRLERRWHLIQKELNWPDEDLGHH